MKSLVSATIIGIALLAAAPAVQRSQSLHAQADKRPREQPRPQQPAGGQTTPPSPPPPSRPQSPAADRPPPQSTGEPELKRRKP